MDLGSTTQQRSQCTAKRNPQGLFVSGAAIIPTLGPLLMFPSIRVDFNLYILFSLTSTAKSSNTVAAEQAIITSFISGMRAAAATAAASSVSNAVLADTIEPLLETADADNAFALAGLLGYVRSDFEFLLKQLRGDVAHVMTAQDIAARINELTDTVDAKKNSAVPTTERSAGIDAVGFRLARNQGGADQKACLFGFLCIDIESTLEFGTPPMLQRCGQTDAELFGALPQGDMVIHSHGRVTKTYKLLDVISLSSEAIVDYAIAPSSAEFTFRTTGLTTLLGCSVSTKVSQRQGGKEEEKK
jgi:hypothetical protein